MGAHRQVASLEPAWALVAAEQPPLGVGARWSRPIDIRGPTVLPWLPLTIPDGVVIVTSALECPAREILLERRFTTLTIGPLKEQEQDALIQQYLGQYTKQLIVELRQQITAHPLGGSPLFLRVLLEELRQCGRYETLAEQLNGYLKAKAIDDLYELVLERLEADGNGGNVCKVMTAIWASRAGLSEEELLAITGLAPLQWAPIDLALEQALGRNGNRLVFDHDYLRKAVEDRYLPNDDDKELIHFQLADWFVDREDWDERNSEEVPWQLQQTNFPTYCAISCSIHLLQTLVQDCGVHEVISYWRISKLEDDDELDEIIASAVEEYIKEIESHPEILIKFVDAIADLLDAAGLSRDLLFRLRTCRWKSER